MNKRISLWLGVLCLALGPAARAEKFYSQQGELKLPEMSSILQTAYGDYHAPDPNRLNEARENLNQVMVTVLPEISAFKEANYWWGRLRWKSLERLVSSVSPDAKELDAIYRGLFSNEKGFEEEPVLRLRDALKEYKEAAYFSSLKNGPERYNEVLSELAALLPRYAQSSRAADRIVIGEDLGFLRAGRLAPELVSAIDDRFSHANSILQINSQMFGSLVNKEISQTKQIDQLILGNSTLGWSKVKGQAYVHLIPSEPNALIEIGMTGTLSSEATSYGGTSGVSVQVVSHNVNQVQVSRLLTIRDLSTEATEIGPAHAIVTPLPDQSQNAVDVTTGGMYPFLGKLKEQVGRQKAVEQMPAGQAEARRQAAEQLETEANKQNVKPSPAMKSLAKDVGAMFKEFYQLPHLRTGVSPSRHWLATDEEWIYSKHVRKLDSELAASAGPMPEFRTADIDIGYRVHESEAANMYNRQLSGQRISDAAVEGFVRNVFNYVPRPLRLGTHVPRWSVELVKDHPLVVDFDDDAAQLAIQVARLDIAAFRGQPRREWNTPFEIVVRYRAVLGKDGIQADRLAPVTVNSLDPKRPLAPWVGAFVTQKASGFFTEHLFPDGLSPATGGMFEIFTKFHLKEFRTEGGWLLVALKFEGDLSELLKKGYLKDPKVDDRTVNPVR